MRAFMPGFPFAVPRRVALVLVVLLACQISLPFAAMAQYLPDEDESQLSRTVLEISRLQQDGNGNELYDWLSLASRELISRESFVAWFDAADRFRPVADPRILAVRQGAWQWPVTGGEYPDIAVVDLAVSAEGLSMILTWQFQFDPVAHRWRWLFPPDGETLVEIQRYPAPLLAFSSTFDDPGYLEIDRFWASVLTGAGIAYQPVRAIVEVTEQPVVTGCGVESDIEGIGIYTCLLDQTIYYSPQLRDMIVAQFGETGWLLVIAHEWSHQVQAVLGIRYGTEPELDGGRYILELESQADCMLGIFAQAAVGSGLLGRPDVLLAHRLLSTYGDDAGMAWDSTTAHGDAGQRVAAFDAGYFSGFVGCGLDLDTVAG